MGWADFECVVFDLEANADRSDPPEHEIIEIGAVRIVGGVDVAEFQTLVRPTRPLRDSTRQLTGITDEALESSPPPAAALRDFYEFTGGLPMIAHNGFRYDFPLLDSVGIKAGVPAPENIRLDTLELAHLAFPRAGKGIISNVDGSQPLQARSLDALVEHFFKDTPRERHRALGDARILRRVLPRLLAVLDGDEPARRLQRWVLGIGRHPWARLMTPVAESVPLEQVVEMPDAISCRPPTGTFNPGAVAAMFDEGGALMSRARQPRRQQISMACKVSEGLAHGGRHLVEAPTGTGKTLAYLAPAIEYAHASGKCTIVAPHSKVLQDQVMFTLEELSDELDPFEFVLLKGRSNYISLESLAGELDALAEAGEETVANPHTDSHRSAPPSGFTHDIVFALAMLCGWVAQTPTGDWDDVRAGALDSGRSALSGLRRRLHVDSPLGPPRRPLDRLEFYRRARDGMRTAHVAVMNHALVIVDDEWLDRSRHLVLDEAHNLEDSATDALSQAADRSELEALCDTLWDPQRRSGTMIRLARATRWSLRDETLQRIRRSVETTRDRLASFGEMLVGYLRIRTGISSNDPYPRSYRIRRGVDTRHSEYVGVLTKGKHLIDALIATAEALDQVNLPASGKLTGRYRRYRLEREISRHGRTARDAAKTIRQVLGAYDHEDWIAIAEISSTVDVSSPAAYPGRRHDAADLADAQRSGSWVWQLRRSPLSVASRLRSMWDDLDAAVLTSATLRVNESFDYVIGAVGLGAVETTVLDSPFTHLSENHLLLRVDYLPAPRARLMEEFKTSAAGEIPRLLMLTGGRGLVLMTARARMLFVRDHVRPILEAEGMPLLTQGDDSAAALVERMRSERVSSLLALRSFWEGVDVPGEALSLLIIEKVPFDSPADPVVGARMVSMADQGKDPFAGYMVPRAALRFAQGAGRLIRTEEDRGVTVTLDSRLCRATPYRDVMLNSLPGSPRVERASTRVEAYRRIADHLDGIDLGDELLQKLDTMTIADPWSELARLELGAAGAADTAGATSTADRLEQARELLGFEEWRPGQLEVMERFMNGRDVLALMPTGHGKSITFQLPALLSPGVTLVISPLVALMNDQTENLKARGVIKVARIHSGVGLSEQRDVLRGVERGEYKLLYVSPERLWSPEFVTQLSRIGLARVAVDEAHCISQWGHCFRPEYSAIPSALERITANSKRPPVLAATATATAEVRRDIERLLQLDLCDSPVAMPLDRPEIRYLVERCDNSRDRDLRTVQVVEAFRSKSAIVYTPTRRAADRIAALLQAAGHVASPYHAGMETEHRFHTEDAFRHGEIDVVVATKAFGMGIDKPDIALIVHLEMPASIEEYVQETGRAARKISSGTAVLMTMPRDCSIHRRFVQNAAPSVNLVRQVWSQVRTGTRPYDPDAFDTGGIRGSDHRYDDVATALSVHYLQEAGGLTRLPDTPWRGRATIVSDTPRQLDELTRFDKRLTRRGRTLVEAVVQNGEEYHAEVWSRLLDRPATDIADDLMELNRRDILGFVFWKQAWVLQRRPNAKVKWSLVEDIISQCRASAAEKSNQAKAFARRTRGCRVRTMLEYFNVAQNAARSCGRCDLCTQLERPWCEISLSIEGLSSSLPKRSIVLRLLDDTSGAHYSRRNLEKALLGEQGPAERSLPVRLSGHPSFGRLSLLSTNAVTRLIDDLIGRGLATAVKTEYEGKTYQSLEITDRGRQLL
ncbi:MAG: RecQ family ATP-dependent DNA helicase [Acidimicrobiaceae bacterium]|nr:RecQ family ATP-dependent DNA helicase [Acidimicrobiaceae bacterium]